MIIFLVSSHFWSCKSIEILLVSVFPVTISSKFTWEDFTDTTWEREDEIQEGWVASPHSFSGSVAGLQPQFLDAFSI